MFRPLILVLLLLAGGVMACDGVMIGDALHGNGSGTGLKTQQGEAWADGHGAWMTALPLGPDTTTHYVVRIDSTFNGYWCNSTNGYEVLRANITYDTTWAPLVTVKLRPDQVEILTFLLSNISDTTIGGRRVLRYNIPTAYITEDCGESGHDNWALMIKSGCLDHAIFKTVGRPDSVVQDD